MEPFQNRNFTGANLVTLFLYGAHSATLFYLPLNVIQAYRVRYRWGYGPRDDQESEFGHSQRRSGWVTRRFV